ncbi:unnamed protein product [Heligmosomoides polygyrus]|uniref:DUF2807 domain-containing protein n=1 Tax=Heligmosomoides polygyrus TaxID=6339 RepID=A0A183FD45_HELPZ|nr:unnamed protein product [Heligmosomoides polygyrus]
MAWHAWLAAAMTVFLLPLSHALSGHAPSPFGAPFSHTPANPLILAIAVSASRALADHSLSYRCVRGGINVIDSESADKIEICGNAYCMEVVYPANNLTVQFPAEVTLRQHTVTIK